MYCTCIPFDGSDSSFGFKFIVPILAGDNKKSSSNHKRAEKNEINRLIRFLTV